jgi:hypothetical protein
MTRPTLRSAVRDAGMPVDPARRCGGPPPGLGDSTA